MAIERDGFGEVLAAAQRGDDRAFAVLWRSFQPRLLRYLRVVVLASDAEDVASTVWLDVARSLSRFDGDEDGFGGWLFTIARRRALDHRRSAGRRPLTQPLAPDGDHRSADDPVASAERQWSTDSAMELIASLKPSQAEVIALRVIVGLDVDEVATLVHKSPGAVRVIAHRGLRELAARVRPPVPAPSGDL